MSHVLQSLYQCLSSVRHALIDVAREWAISRYFPNHKGHTENHTPLTASCSSV